MDNKADAQSTPGEIFLKDNQPIAINADRDGFCITCTNESNELISIGSHYHLVEVNRNLSFDRIQAYGMRLVRVKLEYFENTKENIVFIHLFIRRIFHRATF